MTSADPRESEKALQEHDPLAAILLSDAFSPKFVNSDRNGETLWQFTVRNFIDLRQVRFALFAFVVNSLRKKYHRSFLGFSWSMLNPLLTMCVLTLVFSMLFQQAPKRFALHLFTGLMPWSFISESWILGSTSILGAELFLKKVYLPKAFFPLVAACQTLANFVFSMGSLMVIALLIGMQVSPALLMLPAAVLVLFTFNFAMCLILAVLTVYFRDMTHVVGVFLSLCFYSVPIIYPIEQVPSQYRYLFQLNPLYYFLDLFQSIIYQAQFPSMLHWEVTVSVSAITLFIGVWLLKKKEHDIIYRL